MKNDTIIVVAGDVKFYNYVLQAIASLEAIAARRHADIAILDLGMTEEQISSLKASGYDVVAAIWPSYVPREGYKPYMVGYTARTELRDYFPGYDVYIWFDSDAWTQTDEFLVPMIEGAKAKGASLIREDGPGCKRNFDYNKWLYGNMIYNYGIVDGVRASWPPSFNIGIFALSANAPHWELWVAHLKKCIASRGRMNMDQHAFNAMVTLGGMPYTHLPARYNWIATLSSPYWDDAAQMLVEPVAGGKPLSIVHLAGPDKEKTYDLKSTNGGTFSSDLTYATMSSRLVTKAAA